VTIPRPCQQVHPSDTNTDYRTQTPFCSPRCSCQQVGCPPPAAQLPVAQGCCHQPQVLQQVQQWSLLLLLLLLLLHLVLRVLLLLPSRHPPAAAASTATMVSLLVAVSAVELRAVWLAPYLEGSSTWIQDEVRSCGWVCPRCFSSLLRCCGPSRSQAPAGVRVVAWTG
jgi:hypothetical protein